MNKKIFSKTLAALILLLGVTLGLIAAAPARSATAPIGQTIWLRANANGQYVSADQNLANIQLVANRASASGWETFTIVDAGGGLIALRASNGKYVSADTSLATYAPLVANRTTVQGWETFQWTDVGTGQVTLKASSTGKFVCADLNRSAYLVADRTSASGWETFTWGTFGATPTATRTPTPGPSLTPTPGLGTPFWDTSNIPVAQNVLTFKILNRTNGKYPDSQVYWSFNNQTHSIAEQSTIDMPANSSGRMYFYLGSPTSQYTDFIEFTVGPGVFNGNTTRVDWFGIKLAMRLHAADGYDASVGEDLATFQEDRAVTFQKFINEVPAEFKHLAQNWAPYRISAPGKMGDVDFTPSGQYANYFASYASSVGVSASVFDIMACAGSLANNAAMCSALNRHVAHLAQSQWMTSSLFYQGAPANYYAKFWHDHSIGGLAYGFPYDDYGSYSSFISHGNPQWLLVAVGW